MGTLLIRIIQLCNQILRMLASITQVLDQMLYALRAVDAKLKKIDEHLTRQDTVLGELKVGQADLKAGQAGIQEHLAKQDVLLLEIAQNTRPIVTAVDVVFTVVIDGETLVGARKVDIKVMQSFPVTVAFFDAFGNPAEVDAPPTWETDNPQLLSVVPSEDGMSAEVRSSVTVGSAQLVCRADADLGEGSKEITGTLMVTIHAGDATMVNLNPGEAVDLPAPEGGSGPVPSAAPKKK